MTTVEVLFNETLLSTHFAVGLAINEAGPGGRAIVTVYRSLCHKT